MRTDRTASGVILVCCFLAAGMIVFVLKRDSNVALGDNQPEPASTHGPVDNSANGNEARADNENDPDLSKNAAGVEYDDISDLEALLGDMIEGDIGDAMDMAWSSRSITADFTDRSKVAEQVSRFPIVGAVTVPQERLDQLRNCVTEMIFDNGNSDYESYLKFLRESGEKIESHRHTARTSEEAWELMVESWRTNKEKHGHRSKWEGLVSEGSRIVMFETRTSTVPLGEKLYELRGTIRAFADVTDPPISLEDTLKTEGKVLIAEVQVFIAHDSSLGGVVWPYIIQYWFDPVNESWRVHRAALFQNRHKLVLNIILP